MPFNQFRSDWQIICVSRKLRQLGKIEWKRKKNTKNTKALFLYYQIDRQWHLHQSHRFQFLQTEPHECVLSELSFWLTNSQLKDWELVNFIKPNFRVCHADILPKIYHHCSSSPILLKSQNNTSKALHMKMNDGFGGCNLTVP